MTTGKGGGGGQAVAVLLCLGVAFLAVKGKGCQAPHALYRKLDLHAPIRTITLARHRTLSALGVTPKLSPDLIDQAIDEEADRHGIKRSVLHALVKVESGRNPHAVSRVGAIGLTQVMPFNAKRCGLTHSSKLFDALLNLKCGAQILREEIDQHNGNIAQALTVYNCGRTNCKEGKQYASLVLTLAQRQFS